MDDRTFVRWKFGRKFQNIADGGSAETVHALVVIADDADIPAVPRKQEHKLLLNVVRILVFIDHDIPDALLNLFKNGRVVLQHVIGPGLDRGEVHHAVPLKKFAVTDGDLPEELHVPVGIGEQGIHICELFHDLVHIPADLLCLLPAALSGDQS